MSNPTFTPKQKQPKTVRLVGSLFISVNGQETKISDTFKLQTDVAYTGLSAAQQATLLKAYETSLANENANISFSMQLEAEEIISSTNREPSPLDLMLESLNKPKTVDLVEAVVRDDEANAAAKANACNILGATSLPESLGVK